MAVFPPIFEELMPWDNFQDFVNDFTKGIQELSDLLDPTQDNSGLPVVLGTKFSTPIFWRVCVNNLTDNYSDWMHSFGGQPYLLAGQLNVSGSMANVSHFTVVGKLKDGAWNNLNDSDKAYVDGLVNSFPFGSKYSIVNINDAQIVSNVSASADPTYMTVPLLPYGYAAEDLYYHNLDHNDTAFNVNLGVLVHGLTTYEETEEYGQIGYIGIVGGNSNTIPNIANKPLTPHQLPFIGTTEDQNFIDKYVTGNGSEHNYHVTTTDGYDVYYGDNYYIIKVNDEPVTYNKIYNTMVNTLPDVDPDIHVPTYTENKYGPEPPEPEPVTDDDYISMGLGTEENGMAMFNMAVLTRSELVQLIGDFESTADTGLSFIPHCISLFKLGFDSDQLLTTNPDKIYLHKEPGKTAWQSAANTYKIVDKQKWAIDIGTIKVDREELLTNTFYDFSPYTTYELYIPGCGWITLPDSIVGRTISVHIVFDLCTCSCKGVVRIGSALVPLPSFGTTIATVNGIIGSSVPLSINETGLQRSAILSGATQVATGMGSALIGAGLDNPYMAVGGFMQGAAGMANMYVAGNSTYTNTKGGATDYSIFGDGHECVLKITRPVLDIPDNYGHTIGYVCNEYNLLSEFHGFTVCANPHVHIEATSAEKEEIKTLLEQGVILPNGEE